MGARTSILVGLTAITMLSAACLIANAHPHGNPAHNDNPYVVGGLCPTPPGASVIYNGGGLHVSAANQSFGGNTVAGWEVFNSRPGLNPGSISPTASSVAPVGTYSFTVSGLPPGSHVFVNMASSDSQGGYTNPFSSAVPGFPVSNGRFSHASLPVANPGATLCAEYFFICTNDKNTPLPPYTVTDFQVNGIPIAIDTTHVDATSPDTGFNWCNDL